MGTNYAYRIALAEPGWVQDGIKNAPYYGVKVASALERTIEVIHGIADLHARHTLDNVELYLGRASYSPDHVLSRWSSHRTHKYHQYGTILFSCEKSRVADLETVAIKVLKKLKGHGTLCIKNANVAEDSRGAETATDQAIIYVTWKVTDEENSFEKPSLEIIRQVSKSVSEEVESVNIKQIENGLGILKRLSQKAKLEWYPD